MSWYGSSFGYRPYVPVHRRRANAATQAAKLAKKEKRDLAPITIEGRKIATSFWGAAWCEHFESLGDFENRLPRGRTYVRNGSVIDLVISRGKIKALVAGSDVYTVTIDMTTLPAAAWKKITKECTSSIASLMDLLQGKFDQAVMARLTEKNAGLFPRPGEIKMRCTCPDYASMCKHVAAVLYGAGARLDRAPELLFTLRDVDHLDLIAEAVESDVLDESLTATGGGLAGDDLGAIFGIDLVGAESTATPPAKKAVSNKKAKPAAKKPRVSATKSQMRAVKKTQATKSTRRAKASK